MRRRRRSIRCQKAKEERFVERPHGWGSRAADWMTFSTMECSTSSSLLYKPHKRKRRFIETVCSGLYGQVVVLRIFRSSKSHVAKNHFAPAPPPQTDHSIIQSAARPGLRSGSQVLSSLLYTGPCGNRKCSSCQSSSLLNFRRGLRARGVWCIRCMLWPRGETVAVARSGRFCGELQLAYFDNHFEPSKRFSMNL